MENIYEIIKIINAENKNISDQILMLSHEKEIQELNSLIEQISKDGRVLAEDETIEAVKKYLGSPDTPQIQNLYTQLFYFSGNMKAFANSKIDVDLIEEEINFIKEISETLAKTKEEHERQKENNEEIILQFKQLRRTYTSIREKLSKGENNNEHFTFEENNILAKLALNKKGFQFAVDILNYIKDLTSVIENNRITTLEESPKQGEVSNRYLLEESDIIGLLSEFNIDISNISEKYMEMLRKYGSLEKMRETLKFVTSHEEYKFLIENKNKEKTPSEEKNRLEKLMLTLRYSSPIILQYLIESAHEHSVTVEEIYKIDGVFKHISQGSKKEPSSPGPGGTLGCNGAFEYYQENVKTFEQMQNQMRMDYDDESINLVKSIIKRSPSILKTPSDLIKTNIALLKKYNLEVVKRDKLLNDYSLKCPTVLESRHLEEYLDLCIENKGMYHYVKSYPSILKTTNFLARTLHNRLNGTISFNSNGTLVGSTGSSKRKANAEELTNIYDDFDRSRIEKYSERIPAELKKVLHSNITYSKELFDEVYKNDPVLAELQTTVSEEINDGLSYNVNGVAVSKNKFDKIWPRLIKAQMTSTDENTKKCSRNDLLLYALTYKSIYNDQELEKLETFTREYNVGGNNNGDPSRTIH